MQDKYDGDTPLIKESIVTWTAFPRTQTQYELQINKISITKDDNLLLAAQGLTDGSGSGFEIGLSNTYNRWDNYHTRVAIYIFMNRDVIQVDRAVYN